MIFINPKTDFAFKKIFGSEQSKGILISFLNGILYAGNSIIQDLTILDPRYVPQIKGFRAHHLDVNAQLNSGDWIIIEIQILNVEGRDPWALQEAVKFDAIDLDQGEQNRSLQPIIGLSVIDFEMFGNNHTPISQVTLNPKNRLMDNATYDLKLVFVELPRFKMPLSELVTLTDQWIYFMQQCRRLDCVPERLEKVAEIQRAFELANQGMLMPEELDEFERQEMFIHDQRGVLIYALRVDLEKRIKEEEEEQGKRNIQRSTAQNLLSIFGNKMISQITGLSLEDVRLMRSDH
jgi:predicted transposase/invertase (TIGR01784 family)